YQLPTTSYNTPPFISLRGFHRFVAERRQATGLAEGRIALGEFFLPTALFAEFAVFAVTLALFVAVARGLAVARALFGPVDGAGAAGRMKHTPIAPSDIDIE